jgi:hypothetical protein
MPLDINGRKSKSGKIAQKERKWIKDNRVGYLDGSVLLLLKATLSYVDVG